MLKNEPQLLKLMSEKHKIGKLKKKMLRGRQRDTSWIVPFNDFTNNPKTCCCWRTWCVTLCRVSLAAAVCRRPRWGRWMLKVVHDGVFLCKVAMNVACGLLVIWSLLMLVYCWDWMCYTEKSVSRSETALIILVSQLLAACWAAWNFGSLNV